MTPGLVIVLVVRLTAPLTILRWPLAGAIIAIVADAIDILFFQAFGFPTFIGYNEIDKLLDLYYLSLELIVALGWPSLPRATAILLFAYRLAGVMIFEVTHIRPVLLIFPNLFELYFIFYLLARRFRPARQITPAVTSVALACLLPPKLFQEYALHYARWLDHGNALDIIRDVIDEALSLL